MNQVQYLWPGSEEIKHSKKIFAEIPKPPSKQFWEFNMSDLGSNFSVWCLESNINIWSSDDTI